MVTYIYLIYDGENAVKVGVTNNLERRLHQIQTGNQKKLELVYTESFECNKTKVFKIEKLIHRELGDFLEPLQGEWFKATKDQLEDIKAVITFHRIRYENDDLFFKYGNLLPLY